MRIPIRTLIALRKKDLKAAAPKSRDRVRHRLIVLQVAAQLRKENRAA